MYPYDNFKYRSINSRRENNKHPVIIKYHYHYHKLISGYLPHGSILFALTWDPNSLKERKKKYDDREILLDNGTTRAKEGAIRSHVRPLNRSIRKSNKKTWNRLSMVGSCIDQWRARFRVPLSNWPATTKLPSRMVFFSRKNQGLCSNR